MKLNNKLNTLLVLIIAMFIALGCSGSGTQQAEANAIVDKANKKLEETKTDYAKVETRNSSLFSANIQTVNQLRGYKVIAGSEAKSIVADYERIAGSLKDIAKQYDEISRLNVEEKYKEYAKLKSDEFAKRSEAVDVRKGNAQAFAEIDDPRILLAKFDENNNKSDRLFKDAEEIATKAKKIEEDNKEIFKQA
ncbi:MAG: hypothetical protein QM785_14585 [Pyrinomonadaceae bacterium]